MFIVVSRNCKRSDMSAFWQYKVRELILEMTEDGGRFHKAMSSMGWNKAIYTIGRKRKQYLRIRFIFFNDY